MKNIFRYFPVLFLLTAMLSSAIAQSQVNTNSNSSHGAANITELSNGILQALQGNNFEQLSNFLPADTEVAWLKTRGSEDMKALLQNMSATDLQTKLKTDYQAIIQNGVGNTFNWNEMTIAESITGKSSPKNKILKPVTLVLNNKQNNPVQILFEAIKVKNKYFLFQRMQLKS